MFGPNFAKAGTLPALPLRLFGRFSSVPWLAPQGLDKRRAFQTVIVMWLQNMRSVEQFVVTEAVAFANSCLFESLWRSCKSLNLKTLCFQEKPLRFQEKLLCFQEKFLCFQEKTSVFQKTTLFCSFFFRGMTFLEVLGGRLAHRKGALMVCRSLVLCA